MAQDEQDSIVGRVGRSRTKPDENPKNGINRYAMLNTLGSFISVILPASFRSPCPLRNLSES
jgi:hypothetical protein